MGKIARVSERMNIRLPSGVKKQWIEESNKRGINLTQFLLRAVEGYLRESSVTGNISVSKTEATGSIPVTPATTQEVSQAVDRVWNRVLS